MTTPTLNARDIALQALRDRAGNTSAHLDRLQEAADISPAERALARELALGVVRRRDTLREVLRAFLKDPTRKLPTPLNEVLQLGAYQILFLDRVPDFAAVNEAVAQAIRFRHHRQSGLINGVLRNLARAITREQGIAPVGREILPVTPGTCCRFDRPVFPDPASQPAEYLAKAYSLPLILTRRWVERFGGLEGAAAVAMHSAAHAPTILRVNRLKADVPNVLESLAAAGAAAAAHENGCSVVLLDRVDFLRFDAFRDGWVQVQDATATAVGLAAAPRAGEKVLDFCAAPGTKTTHLAELMNDHGSIAAADVSEDKIARIEQNCSRMGISIVTPMLGERVGGLESESFDLVLADVPCSNTGVLARRAEARWRFDEQELSRLASDQRLLSRTAAHFVRRGGRLVYSTCSIEPEECGEVVQDLLRRVQRFKLVREHLTLPGGADDATRWHDGGYYAILEAR